VDLKGLIYEEIIIPDKIQILINKDITDISENKLDGKFNKLI